MSALLLPHHHIKSDPTTLDSIFVPPHVLMNIPKPNLSIQTRPEIRKGCLWEIGLFFAPEFLQKHNIRELYMERPRLVREQGAFLCLKVRSKLIEKELGFSRVAEIENEKPYLEPNDAGVATLKVKFTQRPRAVFHKHADVMILVVTVKSCSTGEALTTDEHELVFRGGTGSVHSADSRKRAIKAEYVEPEPHQMLTQSPQICCPKQIAPYVSFLKDDPFDLNIEVQPLTAQSFAEMQESLETYEGYSDLQDTMEFEAWARNFSAENAGTLPSYEASYPTEISDTLYEPFEQRGVKRKRDEVSAMLEAEPPKRKFSDIALDQSSASVPPPQLSLLPPPHACVSNYEDKVFQQLFFKSVGFCDLEEVRTISAQSPVPMFVKDDAGCYLFANQSFCNFVMNRDSENIVHKNCSQLLAKTESDEIARSDEYSMAREGQLNTFELSVNNHAFKVLKIFTKLRNKPDCVVLGMVVSN